MGNGHIGDTLEVVGARSNDDVHILRPAHDAPRVDGKAADQDKLHACFRERAEQLSNAGSVNGVARRHESHQFVAQRDSLGEVLAHLTLCVLPQLLYADRLGGCRCAL